MKIIKTIKNLQKLTDSIHRNRILKNKKISVGFVPTMGALHEGHLALIKRCRKENDICIVSIFVNPLQFNNKDDLKKYPNTISADVKLLKKEKVDYLFLPSQEEIYSQQPKIQISIPELSKYLCGATRPNHFEGVLYIVYSLFQWIKPTVAYFGQKDFQQYQIIKTMTNELHLSVKIKKHKIIRETSGLAMSSRNVRLTKEEKKIAPQIYKALKNTRKYFLANNSSSKNKSSSKRKRKKITAKEVRSFLHNELSQFKIDYADVYDIEKLSPLKNKDIPQRKKTFLAVAVFLGEVRLIDNIIL